MSQGPAREGFAIRTAVAADEAATVALWHGSDLVVPHNDPGEDFRFALAGATSAVLLAERDAHLLGSVMVGHDGHRGWIYDLAVDPEHRRQGIGRALVAAARARLRELGVRKLQLLVRPSNSDAFTFYRRIGFERSDVVMLQAWLEP